jgi:WD40 repeat protein
MGAADHLVVHPIKPYFSGHEYRGPRGITDQLVSYHAIPDMIMISERSNRLVKIIEPHSMRVRRAIYVGNSTLSAVEFLPASTLAHLASGSPSGNNGRTTSSLPPPPPAGGLLSPVSSSPLSPFSPNLASPAPGHRKKFSSGSFGNHSHNGNGHGDTSPRSVSQLRTVEENKLLPAKLRAKARRQQQVDEDLKKIDLLAACTTQYLYLWEGVAASSGPVLVAEEIKTQHPITILKWIPEHSRLYAGTSIGTVDAYEIVYEHRDIPGISLSQAVPHLHKVRTFNAHTDCVTAITFIPGMEMLLTSSLDAKIFMWDLAVSHSKPKLKFTSHRAGVVDLAYSDSYRFLLSASIDHEVFILFPSSKATHV